MRWKSHVQCEVGENLEIISNSYLSRWYQLAKKKKLKGARCVAYVAGYTAINSINPFKVIKKAAKVVKSVKKVKKAKVSYKKASKIFKITKKSKKKDAQKSTKKAYKTATKKPPVRGHSPKGYNPKPGERTLNGYVKNNVSVHKEIALKTKSSKFNNAKGAKGGTFKLIGSSSHANISPHVHHPKRNVNKKTGVIYGRIGEKTKDGGVTYPTKRDVKQLYQYLNNGKYR